MFQALTLIDSFTMRLTALWRAEFRDAAFHPGSRELARLLAGAHSVGSFIRCQL